VIPPPGFEWVQHRCTTVLVRADVRDWVVPLLDAADRAWQGYDARPVAGGRGGARIVVGAQGHAVVVRPYRRGGFPARVLRDTYFGWNPRPFRELCATEALRRRAAPVVEVYAAAVRWRLPGCYRGWLVSRYVPGAASLWAWLSAAPAPAERRVVFARVGQALRRLHERGGQHPDLNLNNILVCGGANAPDVVFIDFDRAQASARGRSAAADFARLRRSAQKLDPHGSHVATADFEQLEAAYRGGGTCV